MKIAVANDHAGFPIKEAVLEAIKEAGHEVIDLGTNTPDRVDYPDFAEKAGRALIAGEADRAVVICGSGIGVNITANKMKGVYAGLVSDIYSAHQGVEHDNMNMLCMGGQIVGPTLAKEIVKAFLGASMMDVDRYKNRINKFKAIETEFFK
ncbi:RpiB/LacA/LacB family sugar-phosphate isomerase [Pelolinea submarina]|jgi:ribose 5-phosphate isomerase B|uniref:Ribose 5-phosphate isomerase B n=1 Tax=Pelolinea submarina TaxID=913107 RepID=A0A347ZTT3_9CHLR|nr:RpiB/LacA/LacB family sugar-phosphate isomerase [Pelolinea submarina]REG10705.1 ribose 5-phosphate isomerase B [Pelolinea submarina]BBB48714.1 ribose 5-phosphate isomerase B [Pelolinea submarina]